MVLYVRDTITFQSYIVIIRIAWGISSFIHPLSISYSVYRDRKDHVAVPVMFPSVVARGQRESVYSDHRDRVSEIMFN